GTSKRRPRPPTPPSGSSPSPPPPGARPGRSRARDARALPGVAFRVVLPSRWLLRSWPEVVQDHHGAALLVAPRQIDGDAEVPVVVALGIDQDLPHLPARRLPIDEGVLRSSCARIGGDRGVIFEVGRDGGADRFRCPGLVA